MGLTHTAGPRHAGAAAQPGGADRGANGVPQEGARDPRRAGAHHRRSAGRTGGKSGFGLRAALRDETPRWAVLLTLLLCYPSSTGELSQEPRERFLSGTDPIRGGGLGGARDAFVFLLLCGCGAVVG